MSFYGALPDALMGYGDHGVVFSRGPECGTGASTPWDEHKHILALSYLTYGPGADGTSRAMVRSYIEGDTAALSNMGHDVCNPDVLWAAPGGAVLYPTISHAVLAVPNTQSSDDPIMMRRVRAMAEMIAVLRQLGASSMALDTTGKSAWSHTTEKKVHPIVADALCGTAPETETPGCTIQ
jgi:hypothetical protein